MISFYILFVKLRGDGVLTRFYILLLMVMLFCSSAFAEVKRLAVLEFRGVGMEQEVLLLFSNEVRSGVINIIDKETMMVMTRESTEMILKDMGKDIGCIEGSCEVEIGREIGADYIITGSIVELDSDYVLTLMLHDTHTAELLSSESTDASDFKALRKNTSALSQKLLRKGFDSEEEEIDVIDDDFSRGVVYFDSTPEGANVRLNGKLLCQTTPCSKEVSLRDHKITMEKESYKTEEKSLDLKKGDKVNFKLSPDFGYLNVSSSVKDIEVLLDGQPLGTLPIKNEEVSKGKHVLSIQDECYVAREYSFSVASGETAKISDFEIRERSARIRVSVSDREENAKEAKVSVDGEYLGISPLSEKISVCAEKVVIDLDGYQMDKKLKLDEGEVSEVNFKIPFEKATTFSGEQVAKRWNRVAIISLVGSGAAFGTAMWTHDKYLITLPEEEAESLYQMNHVAFGSSVVLLGVSASTYWIGKNR